MTAAPGERSAPLRQTPQDPLEIMVQGVWEDVLGLRPVPVRRRFADLGGDRALAARMFERVGETCGHPVPAAARSLDVTVAELAAALKAAPAAGSRPSPRRYLARNLPRPGQAARPDFFFMHGDFNGGGFYCVGLAGHLGKDQPFHALGPHIDEPTLLPTIEAMAAEHVARLRTIRPHGPYRLGGHCNGALVAYEMATRLVAEGETVERLILVAPVLRGRAGTRPRLTVRRIARALWRRLRGPRAAPAAEAAPVVTPTKADLLFLAYGRVIRAYRPPRFAGPVTIFWPRNEAAAVRKASLRAWRRAAPRARIHTVPGGHLTAITTHVPALARAMRACLDTAS